jgi:hypothetical protein
MRRFSREYALAGSKSRRQLGARAELAELESAQSEAKKLLEGRS